MSEPSPHGLEQTLLRARRGDSAAFATLVHSHQSLVFSLGLRMLRSPESAEDLMQEVFMQLHRSLGAIVSARHLRFWLRKVTVNRAIDQLRRLPAQAEVSIDDEPELAAEAISGDPLLQQRLRQLVGALPPDARAVILLRYQEDLDPTEIAQALNMPLNTVKSHLTRSMATLRGQLL